MEKLSYKLPVFEGPIDLLLYLVTKNKLNIYEIPITELLFQYLDHLSKMRELDLEVTSEFLEMASKLIEIKSRMLLPRHEEEADPRDELRASLIEYSVCKESAGILSKRGWGFDMFVRQPQVIDIDHTYSRFHSAVELTEAYQKLGIKTQRRVPPAVTALRGIVGRGIVSVISRVFHILRFLVIKRRMPLICLYEDSKGRSELVATFLAVLELIKSKRIFIDGEDEAENVNIY